MADFVKAGGILASASAEVAKMVNDAVPDGKRGAFVSVLDESGAHVGVAIKVDEHVQISAHLDQALKKEQPRYRLIVKGAW